MLSKNEAGYTVEELIERWGSVSDIPLAAWTFPEDADMQAEIDVAYESNLVWREGKRPVGLDIPVATLAMKYCLKPDAFIQSVRDKLDARLPWNQVVVCEDGTGRAERVLGMEVVLADEEYLASFVALDGEVE